MSNFYDQQTPQNQNTQMNPQAAQTVQTPVNMQGYPTVPAPTPVSQPKTTSGNSSHHSGKKKRKKRHFSRSWQIFVEVYTIAWIVLGVALCAVLYMYLDAYEKSQHAHVMDALMEETSLEEWKAYTLNTGDMGFSTFDDQNTILSNYFDTSCTQKAPSYSEAVSISTSDAPVYNIKSGSAYMCRVFLTPDEDLAFGFNTWKVSHIDSYIPVTSFASTTIHVEVPDDMQVFVNGTKLGEEHIVSETPYEDLTELEAQLDDVPGKILYEVTGLFGDIKVTEADGTEIHPQSEPDESGAVFYTMADQTYSIHVIAPSNMTIFCSSIPLGSEYVVSTTPAFLKGFTSYTGGVDGSYKEYELKDLHRYPDVTYTFGGVPVEEEVLEDGTISITYANDPELQDDYEYLVDRFFSSYINYGAGYESEYYNLLSYIKEGTDLYTYVEDSTAAMIWASDTTVDFEYLNYSQFIQWSDNCFSCRVDYKANMSAQAWYESYSYDLENSYDLIFVKSDGSWLCASMAVTD